MTRLRALALGAILLGFWLILSGHFESRMVGFGIGSVALVLYVTARMRLVDEEGVPLHMGVRFWLYFPWLVKEIFIANVTVAKIILDPRLPISPVLVHFRASQKTDLGRVLYANSITLTPGTITSSLTGSDLEIHSLTETGFDSREKNRMDRWVTWVEQGGRR